MNVVSNDKSKYRRPWLAALLSLIGSGLGQLYNRQPRRAALVFLVDILSTLILTFVPPRSFSVMTAFFAFAILWRVGAVIDAFVQARWLKVIPLARYNHVAVYIGLLLVGTVLSIALEPYRRIESFNIPSVSNFSTMQAGDKIIAYSVAADEISRGDIVVFHLPNRGQTAYVKRIVGLPGERVRMRAGEVVVNDVALARAEVEAAPTASYPQARFSVEITPEGKRYRIYDEALNGQLDSTYEQTVPAGHYWVLGDNRDNSLDSRVTTQFGFVPAASIYRKVEYIYWSPDHSRIGKKIE